MAHHGLLATNGPLILALENSSLCGSVALVSPGGCLAESSLATTKTHSKRLLPAIQQVMADSGTNWQALSAIAVSAGPGSFTGLRIGMTTAKGLAMATGKPLIAVSSLTTLACQLPWATQLICPLLDARKQEVYAAFYRAGKDGIPRRCGDIEAITPEALAQKIDEDVIFIGDGVEIYREILEKGVRAQVSFANPAVFFLRAAALGASALVKWQRGEFLDTASATPDYIRLSEAEINRRDQTMMRSKMA